MEAAPSGEGSRHRSVIIVLLCLLYIAFVFYVFVNIELKVERSSVRYSVKSRIIRNIKFFMINEGQKYYDQKYFHFWDVYSVLACLYGTLFC